MRGQLFRLGIDKFRMLSCTTAKLGSCAGFRTSRTQKFSYSFFQPSRTSTRWWYEVASGGREQYRLVRGGWHNLPAGTSWLAEVSGWYEMTGRNFRLVRDGRQKSPF